MLTVISEDVCWSIPNVKLDIIKVSYTMHLLFLTFVTAVCVLFLLATALFVNGLWRLPNTLLATLLCVYVSLDSDVEPMTIKLNGRWWFPHVTWLSSIYLLFIIICCWKITSSSIKVNNYSFKIFLRFWLAKILRIIHCNQLFSTKFGRILRYVNWWRQWCSKIARLLNL